MSERTEQKPRRVGIMGGTFDPIHMAHLVCAQAAADQAHLDAVLFIPAGIPTFKQGMTTASPEARLEMCRLAVANNPVFSVSDREVRREGVTYTIDTIHELQAEVAESAADITFVFIIGSDAFLTLPQWKAADELCADVAFSVVMRPGDAREEVALLAQRIVARFGTQITLVDAPAMDISSHLIREMVAAEQSIRYLVPDPVRTYIETTGLYWDSEISVATEA